MKVIYNLFAAAGIIGVLTYFALIIGLLAGWIMNLIDVVQFFLANAEWTNLMVGKLIGLFFFPLGGILGWF